MGEWIQACSIDKYNVILCKNNLFVILAISKDLFYSTNNIYTICSLEDYNKNKRHSTAFNIQMNPTSRVLLVSEIPQKLAWIYV